MINKLGKEIQNNTPKLGEFRCFNNNKIKVISTLKIHLSSGNSVAKDCEILVVPNNTVNLLGRDILQKLGIHLTQTKQDKKKLKQAMLSEAGIWNQDSDSEPHLDIQYQSPGAESDSDEEPLATKRAPTAQKHVKKKKEKWAAEQSTQQQAEPQPGTSRQTQQAATKPTKKDTTTKRKQKQRKGKAGSPRRKAQQPTKRTNVPQFEAKPKQAALAQSKLEQAKRRQQRYSSIVSTDLDRWNNSDTVEVINLVSDSPLQSPITIVTSSSPKDIMHTPNKGRGSVERIVQKLPINKDNMKKTPSAPVRNIEQHIQQTQNISTEPTRAIQQQQQPTIDDEVPVTILIESDSDHNIMPEEPLTAPMTAAQEPPPTEPTRIANKDTNISIGHSLSDDERCRNRDHSDSPQSSYSRALSEIPHRTTLDQSPISSLDPDDADHLNHIFDI